MQPQETTAFQDFVDLFKSMNKDLRTSFTQGKRQGLKAIVFYVLMVLFLLIAIPLVFVYGMAQGTVQLLRKAGPAIGQAYRAFMHRHFENVGVLGGLAIVLGFTYALYRLDPSSPTLSTATIQVVLTAPFLLFVILHSTIYTYKNLLPDQFRQFMGQLGEKLNESVLPPLEEILGQHYKYAAGTGTESLALGRFIIRYHLLKFTIRCVRFFLYGLPFVAIFLATERLLTMVLNMQPH